MRIDVKHNREHKHKLFRLCLSLRLPFNFRAWRNLRNVRSHPASSYSVVRLQRKERIIPDAPGIAGNKWIIFLIHHSAYKEPITLPKSVTTESQLFKGRLEGEQGMVVAIKEIPVSMKEDERRTQVESLAASLRPLRKFNNENIVRHFGFQLLIPAEGWKLPKYQIVMELCAGKYILTSH